MTLCVLTHIVHLTILNYCYPKLIRIPFNIVWLLFWLISVQLWMILIRIQAVCLPNVRKLIRKILLQSFYAHADTVASARDTDILTVLIAHYTQTTCNNMCLKIGSTKYIPIDTCIKTLSSTVQDLSCKIPYHTITDSNAVFYVIGHNKKAICSTYYKIMVSCKTSEKPPLQENTIGSAGKLTCTSCKLPKRRLVKQRE